MPSESDIRMQVFAHLTSGFTGIGYFTYEDQQGPAMVSNSTRQRRPIYYHVSRLNQEVINVGRLDRKYASELKRPNEVDEEQNVETNESIPYIPNAPNVE